MYDNLADGITAMIGVIQKDYYNTTYNRVHDNSKVLEDFNNSIEIIPGSKYIKIISRGGAHSFIVREPGIMSTKGVEFKVGDILMSASFSAPAKYFSRGNVLDGTFQNVRWTGAM